MKGERLNETEIIFKTRCYTYCYINGIDECDDGVGR